MRSRKVKKKMMMQGEKLKGRPLQTPGRLHRHLRKDQND